MIVPSSLGSLIDLDVFQIVNRMVKGKVQMGTGPDTLRRWDQDVLADCSPEDQVWGWSIRSSEVLHYDRTKIDDRVLHQMLSQSLLDKKDGAPAWTEFLLVKQGLRLSANMVVRVLQRCFKTDEKVRHSGRLLFDGVNRRDAL